MNTPKHYRWNLLSRGVTAPIWRFGGLMFGLMMGLSTPLLALTPSPDAQNPTDLGDPIVPTQPSDAAELNGSLTDTPDATIAIDPNKPDVSDAAAQVDDGYGFIEQQISIGEWEPAISQLSQDIALLQRTSHRLDERLARPLTLLGDALKAKGDFPGALDAYGHALHITRVSDGLHSASQVSIVQKEADAHQASGDFSKANSREEYAFIVLRRANEKYSLELLPGIYRLARWYGKTNNIFAARALYQYAIQILEANGQTSNRQLVSSLRGLATTYRLERFPPFYLESANTDVSAINASAPGIPTMRLDINNMPAGERALKRVIRIAAATVETLQAAEPEDGQPSFELQQAKLAMGNALIEFGDWQLMFDKPKLAMQYYELGRNQQQGLDVAAGAADFSLPKLLYFPTPSDPRKPPLRQRGELKRGFVEVAYTITHRGQVTSLKTIASQPQGLMDFRVRKSLRATRYRPMFVDGVAVAKPGHSYRYEFSYYPKPSDEPTLAEGNPADKSKG